MFALELLAVSQSLCGVIQLEAPEQESTRFSLFYAEKEGRKQKKKEKGLHMSAINKYGVYEQMDSST